MKERKNKRNGILVKQMAMLVSLFGLVDWASCSNGPSDSTDSTDHSLPLPDLHASLGGTAPIGGTSSVHMSLHESVPAPPGTGAPDAVSIVIDPSLLQDRADRRQSARELLLSLLTLATKVSDAAVALAHSVSAHLDDPLVQAALVTGSATSNPESFTSFQLNIDQLQTLQSEDAQFLTSLNIFYRDCGLWPV